jgi:uncharacterized membrane protein YfcA
VNAGTIGLLSSLALVGMAYIVRWWTLERSRGRNATLANGGDAIAQTRKPRRSDLAVGFVTNFFDTLGIGSFAPTTAFYKLRARMADEQIPGTLNTGHALPAMTQALIFIAIVSVDLTTLIGMILASVLGAWMGVGLVARLSRRAIQLGMGLVLVVVLYAALQMLRSAWTAAPMKKLPTP